MGFCNKILFTVNNDNSITVKIDAEFFGTSDICKMKLIRFLVK